MKKSKTLLKKAMLVAFVLLIAVNVYGSGKVKNLPITVTQPDGVIIFIVVSVHK
jgi:hypothetical protein